MNTKEWLNPGEWYREGRGRSWIFSVPNEGIIEVLEKVSIELEDEFDLLHCFTKEVGKREYISFYEVLPITDLTPDESWEYFIRSKTLTPELPEPKPRTGLGWPGSFSLNGFVSLFHPYPTKARSDLSCLGIVHRVRNELTGDIREHGEYDDIFRRIKRTLLREFPSCARNSI